LDTFFHNKQIDQFFMWKRGEVILLLNRRYYWSTCRRNRFHVNDL